MTSQYEYHNFHSRQCIWKCCQICRDHFVNASSHWETMLHCNVVSHWLHAHTNWSLNMLVILFRSQCANGTTLCKLHYTSLLLVGVVPLLPCLRQMPVTMTTKKQVYFVHPHKDLGSVSLLSKIAYLKSHEDLVVWDQCLWISNCSEI